MEGMDARRVAARDVMTMVVLLWLRVPREGRMREGKAVEGRKEEEGKDGSKAGRTRVSGREQLSSRRFGIRPGESCSREKGKLQSRFLVSTHDSLARLSPSVSSL